METIITDYITVHLKNNKMFSNKQFGFIKGRSTVLQFFKVMDIGYGLNLWNQVGDLMFLEKFSF